MVLGPENGIWAPLSEPPLFPKRIMITSIRQQGGSTTAQFTTIVSRLLVKNEFFLYQSNRNFSLYRTL